MSHIHSMLPPINRSTFAANPEFQALYESLCQSKLEPNGASKLDDRSEAEQRVFYQALREARVQAAQQDILVHALTTIAGHENVTAEQEELLTIVAAVLEGHFTTEDPEITYDAIQSFKTELPRLATPLADLLDHDAKALQRLLTTASENSFDELQVVHNYKQQLKRAKAAHDQLQASITDQALLLHEDYRQITHHSIRVLEQTLHGAEARAVRAKVEYLATVAEGMAKKAGLQQNQLLTQLGDTVALRELRMMLTEMQNEDRNLMSRCAASEELLATLQGGLGKDETTLMNSIADVQRLKHDIAQIGDHN